MTCEDALEREREAVARLGAVASINIRRIYHKSDL
jgi:hypothetical protein